MIEFRIETHSGVPPYLQLVQQVKQALRTGILRTGDQLPTVKEVVASIAINPNTVSKAYRELEYEQLVEGRTGVGTFVTQLPAGPPPAIQVKFARSLSRWIESARTAGLDDESIESLMKSSLRSESTSKIA